MFQYASTSNVPQAATAALTSFSRDSLIAADNGTTLRTAAPSVCAAASDDRRVRDGEEGAHADIFMLVGIRASVVFVPGEGEGGAVSVDVVVSTETVEAAVGVLGAAGTGSSSSVGRLCIASCIQRETHTRTRCQYWVAVAAEVPSIGRLCIGSCS